MEKVINILKKACKGLLILLVVFLVLAIIYYGIDFAFKAVLSSTARAVISNFIVFASIIGLILWQFVHPKAMLEKEQTNIENQIKDFTKTLFCNKKIKTYTYKPTFSPEQFEKIFSDIVTNIAKNGKKVLIVFDNLDRCEPKYAYETLSAIKTFMDKKNCMQYSVAVVATMSAGKSTLLNALMVEDLLPTNIMACTSTVFAIIDDDKAEKFMGRHISG